MQQFCRVKPILAVCILILALQILVVRPFWKWKRVLRMEEIQTATNLSRADLQWPAGVFVGYGFIPRLQENISGTSDEVKDNEATLGLVTAGPPPTVSVPISETTSDNASSHLPKDSYIINNPGLCSSKERLKLVITVFSSPGNFEARSAIRQTWGSIGHQQEVALAFLLARPPLTADYEHLQSKILRENEVFRDIIQQDFIDAYRNLTLKSMMMLQWASTFCPNLTFLLKIDDDCFLNTERLLTLLKFVTADEAAIYGRMLWKAKPVRSKNHKWYLSTEDYPGERYPNFVTGPSYLYTRGALRSVLAVALASTAPLKLEDVFLNGICAEKAKVPRRYRRDFSVEFSASKVSLCAVRSAITFHHLSPNQLRIFWWVVSDTRFEKTCRSGKSENIKNPQYAFVKTFLNEE